VELMADSRGPYRKSSLRVHVAIQMAIATTEPGPYDAAYIMTATQAPLAAAMPRSEAEAYLCDLFRCVFGNPFRRVAFDRSWRTSSAVGVARSAYDGRDFSAMPILADALEDAGYDDNEVLEHCRGAGPHVRGCWVIDMVLGNK